MKKKIIFLLVILTAIIISSCGNYSGVDNTAITTPYDYPILPGSNEWEALGNKTKQEHACQLPEEYIERSTTKALLITVLNYPFIGELELYPDNKEQGLRILKEEFNGISEFYERDDAKEALVEVGNELTDIVDLDSTMGQMAFGTFCYIYNDIVGEEYLLE